MNKAKEIFINYVNNYDLKNIHINNKLNQSLRVSEICQNIAKYLEFNEEDINLSYIIGLLHDYSRFDQLTIYNTFDDRTSFDHGDYAAEKLFNANEIEKYYDNKDNYNIIYDAIKYHNKYKIPVNIEERNKIFCKLIRDADKIDIFYQYSLKNILEKNVNEEISPNVKEIFFKKNNLNYYDLNNNSDRILLALSMVFDINYIYSFKYIKDNKLLENIFEKLEKKELSKEYFDYAINYINERIDENVR